MDRGELPNLRISWVWSEADLGEMEVMRTRLCSAAYARIRSGCISRVDAVLQSEGWLLRKVSVWFVDSFLGCLTQGIFICYNNFYLFVETDELSLHWIYSLAEASAQCSSYTIMSKFTFPNREWIDKNNVRVQSYFCTLYKT